MQVRTSDEVMELIQECAVELLDYAQQKKEIDKLIKECKQRYKEEGIAVSKVQKVINKIKARQKQSDADQLEEDIIEEKLEANENIQNKIAILNVV